MSVSYNYIDVSFFTPEIGYFLLHFLNLSQQEFISFISLSKEAIFGLLIFCILYLPFH